MKLVLSLAFFGGLMVGCSGGGGASPLVVETCDALNALDLNDMSAVEASAQINDILRRAYQTIEANQTAQNEFSSELHDECAGAQAIIGAPTAMGHREATQEAVDQVVQEEWSVVVTACRSDGAVGTVHNGSTLGFSVLTVEVEFLDPQGEPLGSGQTTIKPPAPGLTSEWRIATASPVRAAECRASLHR